MPTVLLTGASGFLGIHTVRHLRGAGHTVRALVRDRSKLAANLRLLEVDAADIEVVEGDMTDQAAVKEAVTGADAVVHAAATFSLKRRDRVAMEQQNEVGTRTVLQTGAEQGCDVLVHVSSTVALNRPGGAVLDPHSPLGPGIGPYSASKVASERVARSLQEARAPVTIVNPGAIIGPVDPYVGENTETCVAVLKNRLPAWPRGLLNYVDVRDTADVLTAAITHAPGGRYLVPGASIAGPIPPLRRVTGRRLPALTVPPGLATAATMPGYLTGWSFLPGAAEGPRTVACANPVDSSLTTEELGVTARPSEESFRDTVRWLRRAGHISPRQAGDAGD